MVKKVNEHISECIFSKISLFILLCFSFACLFPFINIIAISLSSKDAIMMGNVFLWPVDMNFLSYKAVFTNASMINSLVFTIFLTALFTVFAMNMTILAAYPLSKKRVKGRKFIMMGIVFTMYFSGGMIPMYMLVNSLGLINNVWALILPGAINTFNLIVLKSFFESLPSSLEESAVLDGASDFTILFRIVLPLSLPIIATLSLFYAVQRWNGFADALFYINKAQLFPLQLKLRQLITLNMVEQMMNDLQDNKNAVISESIKAASLVFATLPLLLVYPWLQKYFVKGVMLGSVKE